MDKRSFLRNLSALSLGVPVSFSSVNTLIKEVEHISPRSLATDENLWARIRGEYKLKPDYINLESGYYCIMPEPTLEYFIKQVREVNYQGSWYMRTVQWENKKATASRLARMAGCSEDELIVTRNTTESLDLVISGQDWQAGDEAVMAEQDYGAMLNQFELMKKRFGIKIKRVSVPNHPKNDEEIVNLYRSAITEKTKLLMVCHMINITGQILPVKKICEMALAKGVKVMVDGAHAFGQINFSINDIGCDYYGTSLHKWLSCPLGAGFLYVKKDLIDDTWPLFAEDQRPEGDISRLNHTGTHPVHTDLAIQAAIDYQNAIGIERKEERLRYLQHYWTSQVRDLPGVIVNSPADKHRHAGIGNVGIAGLKPGDLAKRLLEEYKIWTVAINRPGVEGVRITPNIFTTTDELDVLVKALKELA
ncbi:MAG: aminotransferase class V-fold PLP-dependent enzyme [Fulvivirga sp.]|nr:aminotransferase class V-fold PLP-dependent enzyme [Fulvivirga sp.]